MTSFKNDFELYYNCDFDLVKIDNHLKTIQSNYSDDNTVIQLYLDWLLSQANTRMEEIKPRLSELGKSKNPNDKINLKNTIFRHNSIVRFIQEKTNKIKNEIVKNKIVWQGTKKDLFFLFDTLEKLGFIYSDNVNLILKNFIVVFDNKTKRYETLNDKTVKDYKSKVKNQNTILDPSQKMKDFTETLAKNKEVEKK